MTKVILLEMFCSMLSPSYKCLSTRDSSRIKSQKDDGFRKDEILRLADISIVNHGYAELYIARKKTSFRSH